MSTDTGAEAEKHLYISSAVADLLPAMVKDELSGMPAAKQEQFMEDFKRKSKSVGVAYLLWVVLGLHYGYLGKWGLQVVYWITGAGVFVWAIIDLFRIPGMVRDHNKDAAIEVMRNLKALSA